LVIKIKEFKFHLVQLKIKKQSINKWMNQKEIYYNYTKQMHELIKWYKNLKDQLNLKKMYK
jgi:hypothetical protein